MSLHTMIPLHTSADKTRRTITPITAYDIVYAAPQVDNPLVTNVLLRMLTPAGPLMVGVWETPDEVMELKNKAVADEPKILH